MSVFDSAFILTAGEGTRMRPFTTHTPKPMAVIGGETLIQRILRQCREAGVTNLYANSFHLADKLEAHIGSAATILREETLLNTGLGIKRALPMLGNKPFYAINGDGWWQDGTRSVFAQMGDAWSDDLDLLLVLQDISKMDVTPGVGDYHFVNGIPTRALDRKGTHMFTSIRLVHPRLFTDTPGTPFSFLDLMDRAEAQGRLGAIELDGIWQHLSTEDDVVAVNAWRDRS
jgi:MurNAc alpha-1-phosphate uridylyltransferase